MAADDYYANLAAVRGLRAAGYEPWVATSRRRTLAGRSRATAGVVGVPWPSEGTGAFVRELAAVASRIGAACVLPGTEATTVALAGAHGAFPGIALGACSPETLARAADKTRLAELGADAGLRTPRSVRFDGSTPLELPLPVVVKPVRSTLPLGDKTTNMPPARRVETQAELRQALLAAGEVVVQPFVDGRLYAVAGVAWHGELICTLHQHARRIHPEPCGVSAYAETVPRDHALDAAVAAVLARVGWSGIFELQLIQAGDGPYLIDFNPRFYGSLALAIAAGHNLPAIWVDLLLGRRPVVPEYRVGVRYRAELRDAQAIAALLRRHPVNALRALRPRPHTAHAVVSLRDPLPTLGLLSGATKRLVRRPAS